jgi:hypothetical protein
MKSSLRSFHRGISWDDLPKPFQEAIDITKALGLRYIWIDSLCIIQDDVLDWEQEASKMADVYQNSYITIAVTASTGPNEGCIQPSTSAIMVDFSLSDPPSQPFKSCNYRFSIEFDISRSLLLSPLNRRGWVKQEMALSPRVLHCCHDQLLWQCLSRVEAEHGSYSHDRKALSLRQNFDDQFEALNTWWEWVEDYSNRKLTKPNDKVAAFAGIINFAATKITAQHLAGLWSNDVPFGLLWSVWGGYGKRSSLPNAPSWSWISSDSRILRPRSYEEPPVALYFRQSPMANILSANIQ